MGALEQIAVVTMLNLSGLSRRVSSSLVIVIGVACVVGVLLSTLSFSSGLRSIIGAAGAPDRAIVTGRGTNREIDSGITRDAVALVMDAPGIQKGADGKPIASAETLTLMPGGRKADHAAVTLTVRGIGSKGIALRPQFRLISGRLYRPGTRELVVGKTAHDQFEGLGIGDRVTMPMGPWTIVGVFASGGDQFESEMFGDAETVLSATQKNGFGSVTLQLESADALETLKRAVAASPALNVDVERQSDFYERTAGRLTVFMAVLAYGLGGIMAIGALFGTLNIMYSAVRARSREIAILRAIGFGAAPVAVSVIVEALVLALAGALIGASLAWIIFNGRAESQTSYAFQLLITPAMVVLGITWALVIALLGGLFPAIAASRLSVATAFRSA